MEINAYAYEFHTLMLTNYFHIFFVLIFRFQQNKIFLFFYKKLILIWCHFGGQTKIRFVFSFFTLPSAKCLFSFLSPTRLNALFVDFFYHDLQLENTRYIKMNFSWYLESIYFIFSVCNCCVFWCFFTLCFSYIHFIHYF